MITHSLWGFCWPNGIYFTIFFVISLFIRLELLNSELVLNFWPGVSLSLLLFLLLSYFSIQTISTFF